MFTFSNTYLCSYTLEQFSKDMLDKAVDNAIKQLAKDSFGDYLPETFSYASKYVLCMRHECDVNSEHDLALQALYAYICAAYKELRRINK